MALDIRTLTQENLGEFVDLVRESRARDWSEKFLHHYIDWRYFKRTRWETLLLYAKNRPVAMIDSQLRTYRSRQTALEVRETSEWYCAEKYRPMGFGIRVIQAAMAHDQPLISIRGTEANQVLLPKLGWRDLPQLRSYSLMLNWRTPAEPSRYILTSIFL